MRARTKTVVGTKKLNVWGARGLGSGRDELNLRVVHGVQRDIYIKYSEACNKHMVIKAPGRTILLRTPLFRKAVL